MATAPAEDELLAFLKEELNKAERRGDRAHAATLREEIDFTIFGEVDENGDRTGGLVPRSQAKRVQELYAQADEIELSKRSLQRDTTPIDELIEKGAVYRPGPNRGEINEARLIKASERGRSVDEIADSIQRSHPGLLQRRAEAGHELDADDALRQALQRRFRERNEAFTQGSAASLRREADAIIDRFTHGQAKDFEILDDPDLQPIPLGTIQQRQFSRGPQSQLIDESIDAREVAPRDPQSVKGIKLQSKWLKHPNWLDFEGVDTEGAILPARRQPMRIRPRRSRLTR